jgi:aspartyl-tRNA(Asn)/glutamyl-tRNA(Gln) amidotransferase subunit B
VPLMELVTEPVVGSAEKAVEFTKELQLALRYLGISNADMEKGEMRLEANVSVHPETTEKFGTKAEVKNLNSFKALHDAIEYEIKRQTELLERGEQVVQETRGWDAVKGETYSQRSKEEAHDYRYLPEPDLPPMDLSKCKEINIEDIRASIPEMPAAKRTRFVSEYGIPAVHANGLAEDRQLANYFEETVSELSEEVADDWNEIKKVEAIRLTANYILSDLRGLMNEAGKELKDINITPENMADLVVLIAKGELSSRMAKDILKEMSETGLDPRDIMEKKGMKQVSDDTPIREAINEAMKAYPQAVEDYKKGKQNALQYLFGQSMIRLKGQGNPAVIRTTLQEELDK